MTENLTLYCKKELLRFKASQSYILLKESVEEAKLKLNVYFAHSINLKDKNVYLGIDIIDENGKIVDVFDEGSLSIATTLISIDKKGITKFNTWDEEDLIEDINWIRLELKKITEANNL